MSMMNKKEQKPAQEKSKPANTQAGKPGPKDAKKKSFFGSKKK